MSETRRRGRPPFADVLTPAEWRVVDAVRHGMSNPLIARRQGVSVDAVKFHLSNALAKLGVEDRRQLRRWAGVRQDSALGATQKGKTMDGSTVKTELQLGEIGQVSRGVADIAAAEAWWRDTLGARHLYTFGKLAFFDLGGVRLYLEEGPPATPSVLYFRVADIHAACAELESRGVEIVSAPHLVHRHGDGLEEWMAFFNDNEGRPLALMTQVRAG